MRSLLTLCENVEVCMLSYLQHYLSSAIISMCVLAITLQIVSEQFASTYTIVSVSTTIGGKLLIRNNELPVFA